MIDVISKITDLRRLHEQKSWLEEQEKELAKAKVRDYSLIPRVMEYFYNHIKDTNTPYNRKKMLFVILCIFAPNVLAGYRLPRGLRKELTNVFFLKRSCIISNDIPNLLFYYLHYKDFRADVEDLYLHILDELPV